MSDDLPNGWAYTRLADLAADEPRAITDGPFGSNLKTAHYTDSGPRVIRLQNIGDGVFKREDAHISSEHYESLLGHSVQVGDLVIASLGESLPRACLVPSWVPPAIVKADCIRVRLHPEISAEYVNFALQRPALRHETATKIKGVGRPRLGLKGIRELKIPMAPVAEQRRVVATIEEHFSRLEALTAAVEAAQRRLDALLISVLRETCTGTWPESALSELIVSLRNGVFVSRPSVEPPGTPIYRISAVRPLNLHVSDIRYAHPAPDNADSHTVDAGDLLFTRYSGNPQYVGAAAVVPSEGAGVLHPDKLIRVVADEEKVLPEWIAAYVAAGKGRREIERRLKTTAGQVGISGSQLKTVPIAVPPLSYQEEAAAKIGLMLSEQEQIRQQLADLAMKGQALRRSILADAFSGRLVPQDPTDEPASALLERIASSREGCISDGAQTAER